jgi:hypothetical protein
MKTLIPILVSVMALMSAVPARSADNEKTPQEIENLAKELVLKLGNPSFREREAANRDLVKLGPGALKAIDDGRKSSDTEIRTRCERLYPRVRRLDLERRIEKFLADKDGEFDHDVPLLKVFRGKLGAGDKSRALYVDIMKSLPNAELFDAVAGGDAGGGRAIADRRCRMWNDCQRFLPWNAPTRRQPPLADIAALQFAEWLVPSDSIPKTGPWDPIIGQLMGEQPSAATIESPDKPHHAVYRTIAANWLGSRTDPTEMTNIVKALNNPPFASFKESRTLLRRIVLTEGLQPVEPYRALGMLVQADFKSESKLLRVVQKGELRVGDFPDVYPNEKDPNRKIAIRNKIPIFAGDNHLRDAALAYLVHQEKLNIRDFGFETPESFIPFQDRPLYYNQFAFKTEEQRSFGHAKWEMKESRAPLKKTDKPKKD